MRNSQTPSFKYLWSSEIVGQQPIDPAEDRHSSFQVFKSV